MFRRLSPALVLAFTACAGPARQAPKSMRIWDHAPHNAFTDLVRFDGRFLCAFREAPGHVPQATGQDGVVRILASRDGTSWTSVAVLARAGVDLRDPKFARLPDGRLLVVMGGSRYVDGEMQGRVPEVSFSRGSGPDLAFEPPCEAEIDPAIRGPRDWLWSVTWHGDHGYGFVYQPVVEPGWALHLVRTTDGLHYEHVTRLELDGRPSETAVGFDPGGRMLAVVRRDAEDRLGRVGVSAPPYTTWTWSPMTTRLGGPALLRLRDGTWILGTREYGDDPRTVLGRVWPDGRFEARVTLPSGGDTSYPGLVLDTDDVLVSYYSSHEGSSAIYVARVPVRELR